MPLSSVLGASSVIKPGVCTSTTRPSVPYEGQLIYETDTDSVASWNGSAWVYTHSSGLVLVKTQAVGSGVSSVAVTSAFSADYENYQIIYNGGTLSTTDALTLVFGSTTTGYYYSTSRVTYANSTTIDAAANAASFAFAGIGSTNAAMINQFVLSPFLAKKTIINGFYVGTATTGNAGYSVGFLNNDTSYTGFTVGVQTGGTTITGGTIYVYGYRK